MQAHELRLFAERRELDANRDRLAEFIGGNIYLTLPETERHLLIEQLNVMTQYSNVLGQRIALAAYTYGRKADEFTFPHFGSAPKRKVTEHAVKNDAGVAVVVTTGDGNA